MSSGTLLQPSISNGRGGQGILTTSLVTLAMMGTTSGWAHSEVPIVTDRVLQDPAESQIIFTTPIRHSVVAEWPVHQETTAERLTYIREATGLTWDQIARVFGVSRRAVHNWVAGGRMTARNEEVLARLQAEVRSLPVASLGDRRAKLFAAGPDGKSLLDVIRAQHGMSETDVNRAPRNQAFR